MTRVAVLGDRFRDAVAVLGLEPVDDRPDLVLVDLEDPHAVGAAATIAGDVPRVAAGTPEHERLLRAAGCGLAVAASCDAASIGPLVAASLPRRAHAATRLVVVTSVCGGVGRTLLVAGLAERLSSRVSMLVLDATGSGAAAWWLGLAPAAWSDLEGLAAELTSEHLVVVAAERERLRMIGGVSPMPSAALLAAVAREAVGVADLVLIDAPPLFDERTRALMTTADRVLLLASDDPTTAAALGGALADDARTWVLASRCRAERIGAVPVLRAIPEDPGAARAASRDPFAVGGAIGRAYDAIAELLAIDIT